jgi:signal transduction histidine kinase
MLESLSLVLIGAAAIVDTAVLFSLVERRNWPHAAYSVVALTTGAWLWHTGCFFYLLAAPIDGPATAAVGWTTRMVMAAGLLIMPSAMWHGALQIQSRAGTRSDVGRGGLALIYCPLAGLLPIGWQFAGKPTDEFFEVLGAAGPAYVVWLGIVNTATAVKFLRLRRRTPLPAVRPFLAVTALILLLMTGLISVLLLGFELRPQASPLWFLGLALAPVLLAGPFLYFVVRHNLMRLVLERSVLYGSIVVCGWLVHSVVVERLIANAGAELRMQRRILEGVAVVSVVLLIPALRMRALEALNYLMGSQAARFRDRTWPLALEMSRHAGRSPTATLEWFVHSVREALSVEYVAGWLFDSQGKIIARAGSTDRLADFRASALRSALETEKAILYSRHDSPPPMVLACLQKAKASLAVLFGREEISGLLLFGRQPWNRELGAEETSSLLLLVEQLGAAMNSGRLQAERLIAERRALQAEKLSTLGLVAGSIAHEVKNPLSSIKTIASVLAEELDPEHQRREDFTVLLGEVDRLAAVTHQLLEFARPTNGVGAQVRVEEVLASTVRVLKHLARERKISLETNVAAAMPAVCAEETAVREILFNLLTNSIDALGPTGRIEVECRLDGRFVCVTVQDDGPGIAPEVQDRLFEPFVTTKQAGTGLGLYMVGKRVRECSGEIRCESAPGKGAVFIVKLPSQTS